MSWIDRVSFILGKLSFKIFNHLNSFISQKTLDRAGRNGKGGLQKDRVASIYKYKRNKKLNIKNKITKNMIGGGGSFPCIMIHFRKILKLKFWNYPWILRTQFWLMSKTQLTPLIKPFTNTRTLIFSRQLFEEISYCFKGTVSVITSNRPCTDDNAQFTTLPLKT